MPETRRHERSPAGNPMLRSVCTGILLQTLWVVFGPVAVSSAPEAEPQRGAGVRMVAPERTMHAAVATASSPDGRAFTNATFSLGSLIEGDEIVLDLVLAAHKDGVVGVTVQFALSSDALQVVSIDPGRFIDDGDVLPFITNDADGSVHAGFSRKGAAAANSGTGSLVRLHLRSTAYVAGPATITFATVHLISGDGAIVQLVADELAVETERSLVALPTTADEAATLEDTPVSIDVLANDAPGLPIEPGSVAAGALPANGSVTVDGATGAARYAPAADFCGTDSFEYTVGGVDGHRSAATMVRIDVACVNDPPSYRVGAGPIVDEDAGVVLISGFISSISPGPANESGQVVLFEASAEPADLFDEQPTVSQAGDLRFRTAEHRHGTARVTVVARDDGGTGNGGSDVVEAAFEILVTPVNDPPIAAPDAFDLLENSVLRVAAGALLRNDLDQDGDPLVAQLDTDVSRGTLRLAADGSFVYTPDLGFSGTDRFRYRAFDGVAVSPAVEVALTVTADEDKDGVPASAEDAAPNGGDGNGDGLPDANQENVTSLPIATGNMAGEYLTLVSPVGTRLTQVESLLENPSPDDFPAGAEAPFGFLSFQVRDLAPAASQIVIILVPRGVTAVDYLKYAPTPVNPVPHWYSFLFDGETGALIVADTAETQGYIELHFTDGARGDDDLAANGVLVDPGVPVLTSNHLPSVQADRFTLPEDTGVTLDLLANDMDPDGDPLSILSITAPSHGIATLEPSSLVRYVPGPDFHGTDAFTVLVTDGRTSPVTAVVSLTVTPVNDRPRFTHIPPAVTVREGEEVSLQWVAEDVDGDVLTFFATGLPAGATLDPAGGHVTWTARAGVTAAFVVSVTDGTDSVESIPVVITVQEVERFAVVLAGVHQRPGIATTAAAQGELRLIDAAGVVEFDFVVSRLTSPLVRAALYVGAVGEEGVPIATVPPTRLIDDGRAAEFRGSVALSTLGVPTGDLIGRLRSGGLGLLVSTQAYPDGEARGQLLRLANRAPSSPGLSATPVIVIDRPDALAEVTHGDSIDPDGDPVLYIVQIAVDAGFSRIVGERVRHESAPWTLTAAWILKALRGGPRSESGEAIDSPRSLHARVIASDGALWAVSTTATIEVQSATGVSTTGEELPTEIALGQNYPNPFNPVTTVRFDLPLAGRVRLSVYDVMGRRVGLLVDATVEPGRHSVAFDATHLPSGTYLYRLEAGSRVLSRSMVLLK